MSEGREKYQVEQPKGKPCIPTPGPWEVYGPMVFSPGNGVICQLSEIHPESNLVTHQEPKMWSPDWEEVVGNGRLIAAAPDLLAACQLVLDECQDILYTARLEAVTAEIKKAVARVKGGDQ